MTRVLTVAEENRDGPLPGPTDSLKEMLDAAGFGVLGRTILDWQSNPPRDLNGDLDLPPGTPTGGDVQDFLEAVVLPEISGAVADLAQISSGFVLSISGSEVQSIRVAFGEAGALLGPDVEVDYGDVLIFRAGLHFLRAHLEIFLSYDLDVETHEVFDSSFVFDLQQNLLDPYPGLLNLRQPGAAAYLEGVRQDFIAAIDIYLAASTFIELNPASGVFELDPSDMEREARRRLQLQEIRPILDDTCANFVLSNGIGITVNACAWLSSARDLRGLLPPFDYDPGAERRNSASVADVPDLTLGGVLPVGSQVDLTELARGLLRPPNDDATSPISLGNGSVVATLRGATNDGSSTSDWLLPGSDVWYHYRASRAGTLLLGLCGSDSEFGTKVHLSLHSGVPGTAANELEAVSLGCPGSSFGLLQYEAEAGEVFWIRVAPIPFVGDEGRFRLTVPEPDHMLSVGVALALVGLLAARRRHR